MLTETNEMNAKVTQGPHMARKPLILDLATLDLSSRAIDRAALEKTNPHRDQMAQLDYVLWHSADYREGVALRHTRPDEFWVKGHFPGRPMMPGVLMVEAGAQLASFLFNSRFEAPKLAAFAHIDDCTFRHGVNIGDDLYLLCKEIKFNPRRFITQLQGVVNGKVAFEAQITGIALDL